MKHLSSVRLWLGLFISAFCLWLALRNVPLASLGESLARAEHIWLMPAVMLQLVGVVPRAQRWVVLLSQERRLADSFWAQGIGYLFTNVLPFRMGEPARVAVMSKRCHLPIMQVGASAIVERLLDVATIVLVMVLILPWMPIPAMVTRAGVSFGILTLLGFVGMALMVRFRGRSERLLRAVCRHNSTLVRLAGRSLSGSSTKGEKLPGWFVVTRLYSIVSRKPQIRSQEPVTTKHQPMVDASQQTPDGSSSPGLFTERIIDRWQELVDGLAPLTSWSISLRAIAWSLVTWSLTIAMYWFILRAFQSDARLVEAAFVIVALALAITVPSSPGFIGVFQLVGQQALVLPFGDKYDPATAFAITLTGHLTYYFVSSALGVIGLWRLQASFLGLRRVIGMGKAPQAALSDSVR